jgi:hypothetical protein
MEVGTVEHERDPVADAVIEPLLMGSVAVFRERRSPFCQLLHFCIIVDVEMLRAKNLPVKLGVLDLISPEVVELGGGRLNKNEEEKGIFESPDDHNNWNVEVMR